jgi:hypothetical protein
MTPKNENRKKDKNNTCGENGSPISSRCSTYDSYDVDVQISGGFDSLIPH